MVTHICYIGKTEYPDMAAEMADLLLRIEQIRWAICMNTFENQMIISVRTQNPNGGADDLVKYIAKVLALVAMACWQVDKSGWITRNQSN